MKQDSINSAIFLQNGRSKVLNNRAVNYIEFHSGHLNFRYIFISRSSFK